ncbi:MAG: ATP-dependent Clp protease proteolytic subunit [Ruminococcaceae bacterium]|nr:ATP-dependent Clp protease proteolytic subunit [Oscillospiraceae bacterium]
MSEGKQPLQEQAQAKAGILELGQVVTGKEGAIQTLVIAGQIEGHSTLPEGVKATRYEHILPSLVMAEESDEIGGVLLLINTMGGDVEAGLCMAELIAGMKKPTAALVLGGGHSIGIPLAVSAKRTFIAESATMTVHPVRINGLVLGVPQSFEYLRKMQERILRFITDHSHILPEKLEEWMQGRHDMATDIGTVVHAREAVSAGLVDEVGTLSSAIAWLKEEIKAKKAP